jgi:DNA repair protein RecO (recombination protein O)
MAMVELIDVVTHPDDPNPAIFKLLESSLQAADHATSGPGFSLYRYEARLLTLLGFRPLLADCTSCGAAIAADPHPEAVRLGLGEAGVVCASCAGRGIGGIRVSSGAVGLLRGFLETGGEETVLEEEGPVLAEAGRALRWFYAAHIHGFRGLKSERVFESLGTYR